MLKGKDLQGLEGTLTQIGVNRPEDLSYLPKEELEDRRNFNLVESRKLQKLQELVASTRLMGTLGLFNGNGDYMLRFFVLCDDCLKMFNSAAECVQEVAPKTVGMRSPLTGCLIQARGTVTPSSLDRLVGSSRIFYRCVCNTRIGPIRTHRFRGIHIAHG